VLEIELLITVEAIVGTFVVSTEVLDTPVYVLCTVDRVIDEDFDNV